MKNLKKQFRGIGEVKGYQFTQIRSADNAFLYEVGWSGGKHYEVFKKVVNRRFACISYSTSRSFGKWAFTYNNIESAIKKYNELKNNENTKKI